MIFPVSYSFTKLFSTITDSSIWSEDSDTRVVWVTMLAMADRKGRVLAALPGLSKRAGVSLEKTEQAIKKFTLPDKYSRSKACDGRRIDAIDGGWKLVNYEHYRELRDEEAEKERKRDWATKNRRELSKVAHGSAQSTQAEAEAEAEKDNSLAPAGAEHRAFIKGWSENWKDFFGCDYAFQGGKDGKAASDLLKMGILRIDLLEIAKDAWLKAKNDNYCRACKDSSTIHGFRHKLNQIRVELQASAAPKTGFDSALALQELKRIDERLKFIEGQGSHEAFGVRYTAAQKLERAELFARRRLLKGQLGFKA